MTNQTKPYRHDQPAKTAVVLINLGTPDAPTAAAVRPYLREFLSDTRVVEIPRPIWWIILNCIILPFRSGKSAAKYAAIWTSDGSPLKVHTQKQAALLKGYLGERNHQVEVFSAMRYGQPSVPSVLKQLHESGYDRILILPAYPHYSATTTASIYDAVFAVYKKMRNIPDLRLIKHYHDHPGYIAALKNSILKHWESNGRSTHLVLSFHGVPKRTLMLGDPYHCECYKTARLLTHSLGLSEGEYTVTFQSRFGRAEWLQPYTQPTIEALAKQGLQRVDVICPGFTSDCLETLEEINMEVRAAFLMNGGKKFHYISCLNEDPLWLRGMAEIVGPHLHGWPVSVDGLRDAQQNAVNQAALAKKLGAAE